MKKVIDFFVLSITILTANIVTGYITDYFLSYKGSISPLKFTALGMVILVAVFYPIFEFLEIKIEAITKRLIKKGKNTFGKTIGFLLVVSISLLMLYCVYANLWFDINIPKLFWSKI